MTAGLSRRRSRVRAPSSPPFLSNVSLAFSNICRHMPRLRSRRNATSTDTKCPRYSERTVAATVALGDRLSPRRGSGTRAVAATSPREFHHPRTGGHRSRNFRPRPSPTKQDLHRSPADANGPESGAQPLGSLETGRLLRPSLVRAQYSAPRSRNNSCELEAEMPQLPSAKRTQQGRLSRNSQSP